MKQRVDEVVYYEWSTARWAYSKTRMLLDATGRGIFRELLDICYSQGGFSSDPEIQMKFCACTREQLDRSWPVMKQHFHQDKNDPSTLRNHFADLFRKEFFKFLKRQRTNSQGRKKNIPHNSNGNKEISNSGLIGGEILKRNETKRNETRQNEAVAPAPIVAPKSSGKQLMPVNSEDSWFSRYRELFEATGKRLNEEDWNAAAHTAVSIDINEKQGWQLVMPWAEAEISGWTDRPEDKIPLPKNHLASKGWTRKSKANTPTTANGTHSGLPIWKRPE